MARLISLAVTVAVVLALASSGAAAPAPAPTPAPTPAPVPAAPAVDCSSAVTRLIGCLPYVQQGSTQGKPARECCAGVKAALQSPAAVACLCAAFGQSYGIPLNLTRAAALPAACGEDPAAFSECNIQAPGTGAPASAPTAPGTAPAAPSPGSSKSAAVIRSPVSLFAVVSAPVATILMSYTLL